MTSHSPTAPLVLIVDDNERNRKLVRDVLHSSGLATLEAGTGAEAIAVAAERLPNVILLDLNLPDIAGTEVARRLAAVAQTMHIPVVALSALHDAGNHDWLLRAGFAGFLSKPIDVVAFPDQVRGYCEEDDA